MPMTACQPCPPAPGPLEGFAAPFDSLFGSLGQRRSFRHYLSGLLAPRDRNKTLTALAGAEPLVQAQSPAVQRPQCFLSEADWSAEALNARRLALLQSEATTAAHRGGVLVLDDTGDRKDGTATAHVGRQYLGSVGKIDNGIVTVTSLWTDGRAHYPLHVAPYTLVSRFAAGAKDPRFRTKPQIAIALIEQARAAGIPFRAIVADCFYGPASMSACRGRADLCLACLLPPLSALLRPTASRDYPIIARVAPAACSTTLGPSLLTGCGRDDGLPAHRPAEAKFANQIHCRLLK
jgi:SRSO17 transposase